MAGAVPVVLHRLRNCGSPGGSREVFHLTRILYLMGAIRVWEPTQHSASSNGLNVLRQTREERETDTIPAFELREAPYAARTRSTVRDWQSCA